MSDINTTPFVDYIWKYAWVLVSSVYKFDDLATIAFETEALIAGVEPSDEFTIVDYVEMPPEDCDDCGILVMHKERPTLH